MSNRSADNVCQVARHVGVLWLFLALPWVGLQCVFVVFPDHTHFFHKMNLNKLNNRNKDIYKCTRTLRFKSHHLH